MVAAEQDRAAVQAMTPQEKLAVLHSLIAQAWALKEAWIRDQHPELPEEEVRMRARRMVGGDST